MDDLDTCPRCGSDAHCNEYDADEDIYVMICDNDDCRHSFSVTDDTEVWK